MASDETGDMPAIARRLQSWNLTPPPASLLASLLLHAALLALIVAGQLTAAIELPSIRSVDVDLISAAQFAALIAPPKPAPVPPPALVVPAPSSATNAQPPAVEAAQPTEPSNGPFRAENFYAGSLLAEPASAMLRAAMRTLADPERIVQLCDIEAMEQVRRARPDYDPDMVVPYAMADMLTSGAALVATGGAFRSRREWYEISFRCTPSASFEAVESFEFTLGDQIPHELWEAHDLTAEEMEE